MTRTLALVHTVPPLVPEFSRLCRELLPGVRLMHVLDEPLLERIRLRGTGAPEDDERLAQHVQAALDARADAVLVTCSTVSLSVDAICGRFRIPVLKIDDAMAQEAVRIGGRISVVATNPPTLEPSRRLLLAEAARAGRQPEIALRVVDRAFAALLAGDGATHDELVEAAVREEAVRSDVVVLAQASMARVMAAMAAMPAPVPVLSSPHLALAQVRALLGKADDLPEATGGGGRP